MSTSSTDRAARLAACSLVRTRFVGRAQLEREARASWVAIVRLEHRLGLATDADLEEAERLDGEEQYRRRYSSPGGERQETDRVLSLPRSERIRQAMTGELDRARASVWFPAQPSCAPMLAPIEYRRRQERAQRAAEHVDPLATRSPGHARRTIAVRRAEEIVCAARFRTATHGHERSFSAVEPGHETAKSLTDSVRPSSVGLPNAYAKKGFFVITSEHRWSVSVAILSPEVRALNAAAPEGVVWLSTTCRVRQGRGTSLVCERVSPRQRRAA